MATKLNSINPAVFNPNSAEFTGVEKERAYLVTCGRTLMADRHGRDTNNLRCLEKRAAEYTPILQDGTGKNSYAETNQNLKRHLMLYCAKRCCAASGETPPADYDAFLKQQRRFLSDGEFLRVLSGVAREIVTPTLPTTLSDALEWLAETYPVPVGQTRELDIQSNDIFFFEDDSWGASRSKPSNYLYSYPVTLNPTLRTAKATMKWYQLVGNDADLGQIFNAIAAGMYSKITALGMSAMSSAATGGTYIPTSLQFTNTSANWVTAASKVATVNGTRYWNTIAIGHPSALTEALPSGVVNASSTNLDAALATMLGVDWARYGFLGEYMGIRLMPLNDAIVPGTQNSSITTLVPTDKVWILPIRGYRPLAIGIEDGTPITLEITPDRSADMTLDILVSISLDVKPVFASKIAQITV